MLIKSRKIFKKRLIDRFFFLLRCARTCVLAYRELRTAKPSKYCALTSQGIQSNCAIHTCSVWVKSVPCCRLCHRILPKKQRCTIFGERFGVFDKLLEIIDYVPHPNDDRGQYICGMCWNKLNKLGKIEHDIKTKVESLRSERQVLIRDLRLKHNGDISKH